jgi:hypothetical protein
MWKRAKVEKSHFVSIVMQKLVSYMEVKVCVLSKDDFLCVIHEKWSCKNYIPKVPNGEQNDL